VRFAEALVELEARGEGRMVPNLERITALAELLDHPQRTYPSIHVTGTNGKTTTTRLISRILCGHGLAAGAYTSPHLSSVTERVALCAEDITEEEFAEAYEHLLPYLRTVDEQGEDRVTYFEALTSLAYLWFADKPVDAGVFEVGMGGEWDATNLIEARVAVVREVALDHPELGATVEEVAREKAGVIKPNAIVITHDAPTDAFRVIEERAREMNAHIHIRELDFGVRMSEQAVGGQRILVKGLHAEYDDLFLPFFGEHQADNAAAAIAASEAFINHQLDPATLREAFGGATSPGRLEIVSRHPLVVLDGAHNPAASIALAETLPDAFVWKRLHLVIAVLETKDVAGIVAPLATRTSAAYACANSNAKSLAPDRMAAACDAVGMKSEGFASVADALDAAEARAEEDDLILVTGSLYTVADARPRYVKERSHGR
jgi:dihydrofolate synthase / folylpolyglutamate synthase